MTTSIFLNNNNEAATINIETGHPEGHDHFVVSKTWEQLTDSNKQDIASQWIKDNVYCNVNQVMELLSCCDTQEDYETYLSIAEYQDFEYASTDHINDLSIEELLELIEEYNLDLVTLEENEGNSLSCITHQAMTNYIINNINLEQYGQDNNLEPEYQQAYEFWNVSDHFVSMLQDTEQCSNDILGLSVWARYCTGQSICLDTAIQKAAFKVLSDTSINNY